MSHRFPALLLSLSLALPCFAASGVSLAQTQAATPDGKDAWVSRLREAHRAVETARRNSDEADRAYRDMRHRRRARGEAKSEILERREQAAAAVEAAERQLEDLRETARRAGVPPGWIREALEEPGAASPES